MNIIIVFKHEYLQRIILYHNRSFPFFIWPPMFLFIFDKAFVYFLVIFLHYLIWILMVFISLELKRINPDLNVFSKHVEDSIIITRYRKFGIFLWTYFIFLSKPVFKKNNCAFNFWPVLRTGKSYVKNVRETFRRHNFTERNWVFATNSDFLIHISKTQCHKP